jgi:phosphoglycolate phosphatase
VKSYEYLFFDLDGTLTDPAEGITKSVEYALNKFGITVADRSELLCFIGPPLVDSFRDFFGFSDEDAARAVGYYREYFPEKGIFDNRVYDGIPELLAKLRTAGRTLVLATSKPEEFARRIMDKFDLARYFKHICGATFDGRISKKAEVIEYAIETAGITDRSAVLMIGDREHDVLGAKAAGVDSLGVLFGYGDRPELEGAGATYIAESVEELGKMLI